MYYGDYYRGDYYRGDPGIFGAIGGAIGGFAKGVVGAAKVGLGIAGTVLPGPAGIAARAVTRLTGGTRTVQPPPPTIVPPSFAPQPISRQPAAMPLGPIRQPMTAAERERLGLPPRKRRRMNHGNVKALRRADRRIDGFVGVARKALKHTNYKVVSKSAGRGRAGSRGVITRSEAARALRS